MKQKEPTKSFMMILNWKKSTLVSMLYTKIIKPCKSELTGDPGGPGGPRGPIGPCKHNTAI